MTGIEEFFAATAATDAAATAAASGAAAAASAGAIGTAAGAAFDAIATGAVGAASGSAFAATTGATLLSTGQLLGLAGTGLGALSAMQAGNAGNAAAKYNTQVANDKANADLATGIAAMSETQKKTDLMLSRNRALAAAGGGSASDPTVVNNAEEIAGQGEYNSLMDLYNGESRYNADKSQGAIDTYEGQVAQQTGLIKAGTTLFTGVGSTLQSKYGATTNLNQMTV